MAYLSYSLQIIISLIIVWSLCGILTATDTLPEDDPARVTDLKKKIDETAWFYFPYPGKYEQRVNILIN